MNSPLHPYYLEMAAQILGISITKVPKDLAHKLESIDTLVKKFLPNKELCSSQLIAYIIYEWQENEKLLNAAMDK